MLITPISPVRWQNAPQKPQQPKAAPAVYFAGNIQPANRLNNTDYLISSYIKEIGKARWLYGDRAVIDMSMGNPDLTPPVEAQKSLQKKVNDLWSHRYNNPKGEGAFLKAVSDWMKKRYDVEIDPRTEVMVTSGSSDAIDHIFTAYANSGDKILVPNPGYSLYGDLIARHDLKAESFDLLPENKYLPDFSKIKTDAKIMILNYPHNPTGSFAPKKVFEDAVKFAKDNDVLLILDIDNSEISHTGEKPPCIMEIEGAKDVAFQVQTFSKAQSMPGFRVAFAVSNKEFIDNLLQAKYLSGGSVYTPVQHSAIAALQDKEGYIEKVNNIYRSRKNTTIERLRRLGSDAKPTDGTYYLWAKIPEGFTSNEFFKYVLHKSQVALTPGTVFGKNGEGYVRIVMSTDENTINKAFDNMENAGIRFDVSKYKLSPETREEIRRINSPGYVIKPKADRDFEEYIKTLPDSTISLPRNISKNGQIIYLQNVKQGKPLFGQVQDVETFSADSVYKNLGGLIKKDWVETPGTEVLPVYKTSRFYPDATYFTLMAEDKLQAIGNLEMQSDGIPWVRCLNAAPWNQGQDGEIRGCGSAIMARMVSFCLERGHDTMKLATDKPENIRFYKNLGMKEAGIRNFAGVDNTVLYFDKEAMKEFLNNYQSNLSC